MSGWRTFKALLRNPKADVTVLVITFFLTVVFDLTVAIEAGLVIACVLFMHRVMETTEISVVKDEIDPNKDTGADTHEEHIVIPDGKSWPAWATAPRCVSSGCARCPSSTRRASTTWKTSA